MSGGALVRAVSALLGVPGCQLRHGLIDPPLLKLVGSEEAERLRAVGCSKSTAC